MLVLINNDPFRQSAYVLPKDTLTSSKGSFFNQDEWLQEVEEHERKLDTSEKQSDFAGIFTDLDRIPGESYFFYCVIWSCFL